MLCQILVRAAGTNTFKILPMTFTSSELLLLLTDDSSLIFLREMA